MQSVSGITISSMGRNLDVLTKHVNKQIKKQLMKANRDYMFDYGMLTFWERANLAGLYKETFNFLLKALGEYFKEHGYKVDIHIKDNFKDSFILINFENLI